LEQGEKIANQPSYISKTTRKHNPKKIEADIIALRNVRIRHYPRSATQIPTSRQKTFIKHMSRGAGDLESTGNGVDLD
jgi:hypothetical protein